MQLSCKAIAEKQFSTARKGYDVHEVDSFMDELLSELKRVFSEMDADKFELAKYREIEYTLTNTLVTAQKTAQTIVAEAEAKAAAIVDEAKAQADHTKAAADSYARERKAADEEEATTSLRHRLNDLIRFTPDPRRPSRDDGHFV